MFIFRPFRIALGAIALQVCLFDAHPARATDATPQVDLNGAAAGANATATFVEDAGAVTLCPDATVTDDGSILALTLKMTPHPEGMDEILSAVPVAGLAVTYNRGDGEMLINGVASASTYQQVLRTLSYLNSSHIPTATTRLVTVIAYDGNTSSTPRTVQVAVLPVDDPPVIDLNGSASGVDQTLVFVAGGGAVTVAPAATITDPDGTELTSMTVTLASRPNGASETLAATGGGGVSASYNGSTGILLLSGRALLTSYQAALRTVSYNNSAGSPDLTTRTLTVTGWDGGGVGGSATAKIRMSLVPINAPPVIDLNGSAADLDQTVRFVKLGGPVTLAPAALVTDDGEQLTSMTLRLAARPNGSAEVLAATGAGGITPAYDSATGILLLSGASTLANYQAVLRGVTYDNTSSNPDLTTRTVTVTGWDAGGLSGSATARIAMAAANAPPVIDLNGDGAGVNQTVTFVAGGSAVTVAPEASVTDDDTQLTSMTLTLASRPNGTSEVLGAIGGSGVSVSFNYSTGLLKLSGKASLASYQAALRTVTYANGAASPDMTTRTLTVRGWDVGGLGGSAVAQIRMAATPPKAAPVVDLNGTTAGVDNAVTFNQGAAALALAPAAGLTDDDSTQLASLYLTWSVARPNGSAETLAATGSGGVTVHTDATTGNLWFDGVASLAAYQAVLRTVTYRNVAAAPDVTTRTLVVTAYDTDGTSGTANERIRINRPPTAISPSTMSVAENTAVGTVVGTMTATDPNPGDTHTFAFALPYANGGKFSLAGNAIKVASAINYETTQSVTVTVKATDAGGLSYTRNIVVAILNVNETPVNIQLAAVALSKLAIANETVVGTLSATDPDAAQTLTYSFTSPYNNCGGRFKVYGNQLRIANAALIKSDAQADYSVSVRVTDQGGLTSAKDLTVHISNFTAAHNWNVFR